MASFLDPRLGMALLASVVATGCASAGGGARTEPVEPASTVSTTCDGLAAAWDLAATEHGVADAQAARLEGFPWVRADRLTAGIPLAGAGADARRAWVASLAALDREARGHEHANLPEHARAALGVDAVARSDACRDQLVERTLSGSGAFDALVAAVRVPSSYDPAARLLGLYPVTSMPFLGGVERLHAEFAAVFETPLDELPVSGRLERLAPADDAAPAPPVPPAIAAALGPDAPDAAALARLFERHAPIWEVDVVSDDDRIGRPGWTPDGVSVDTAAPVVYRKPSLAWLDGRALLQLSYVAWFPARPPVSDNDLLAGHVDGITWRVTLDEDGEPLLYDAMHNCGCYHTFFPTERLRRAPDAMRYEEPPLVAPVVQPAPGRVVLRIAHRTHYIENVYSDVPGAEGRRYALADYDSLRSLEVPGGGRRSLFGPDGLVPGTERGERFFFWPMGVRSAGAMRQWGHHATAFVGERHFDDPGLVARYFERAR